MKNLKLITLILATSGYLINASDLKDRVNSASMWEIKNFINNNPADSDETTQAYVRELLRQMDARERTVIGLNAANVKAWRDFLSGDQKAPVFVKIEEVELAPSLAALFKEVETGRSDAGSLLYLLDNNPNSSSVAIQNQIRALIQRMDRSLYPNNIMMSFASRRDQIAKWRAALGL